MIVFTTETTHDLEELRQRIQGIDYSIMSLIKERIQLAKQVGSFKVEKDIPIRNYQVEKQVITRIERYASEFDFDPNIAKSIYLEIIKASVNAQLDLSKDIITEHSKKCLVYGGAGKMGKWMVNFLRSSGHICHIKDPKLPDSRVEELNYYDFVILATPLSSTRKLLENLVDMQPQGIIFDIASLKSQITDLIIEGQQKGVKVSSIHPMFGPDVISLEERNIIICETELSGDINPPIVDLFKDTSVNLVSTSLLQHDVYISYTLGLAHFLNLLMGYVLESSEFSYDDLRNFAGTTFLKQMHTTREVFSENPDLYYAIQHENDFSPKLYTSIHNRLSELKSYSLDSNPNDFIQKMLDVNNYLDISDQ